MSGCSYRPRPYNGSGDSPRPPFLTEFVNQVSEFFFAELVYNLICGQLSQRVHPHVQGSFRLKTESALRVFELHRAQSKVRQHSVRRSLRHPLAQFRIRTVQQGHRGPVRPEFRRRLTQTLACQLQRLRILIEANQMTLCAEAFCDFETVSAQAEGRIDIGSATLDGQKIDRL